LEWLETLHRMALRDRAPLLVGANDGDASLWLPLMQAGSGHHVALANWYNFHWRPIFTGAQDEVTKLALLREAAATLSRQTRRLTLSPLPDEDHSATLIANAFGQTGWVAFRSKCDNNHILRVNGRSFDAYWNDRPGRLKNTVKRKGKTGIVSIRIEREFKPESWADYERVYAKSWKPHEGSPDFLRQLAQSEGMAGALRLGLAYIDGQPVAAQFWTVENGSALIHKLAYDERHVQASPGTLLSAAMFQHALDVDRVDLVDYGTGSDAYKAEWMDAERPRFRLELFWPNHPANWPHIVIRTLRAYRAKQ
jgi:Acetyltransferase (GNAT) domain